MEMQNFSSASGSRKYQHPVPEEMAINYKYFVLPWVPCIATVIKLQNVAIHLHISALQVLNS